MKVIRKKNTFAFERVFGVPISQYWDDDRGGFQVVPFMTQVLEYEGPSPYNALSKKFGVAGLRVIGSIMADVTDYWTVPF